MHSVAIIDQGRARRVRADRRAPLGGPRLIRVDVLGAPEDWTASLAGVRVVERTGRAIFALDPRADPQAILDSARRAGTVTYFAEQRPSLAELFREVISP